MQIPVISFVAPVEGIDGEFNTFRLGKKLSTTLKPGDEVLIMDGNAMMAIGRAEVIRVELGRLAEMCVEHAAKNHRELTNQDTQEAPARLFHYIQKLYGPHIATMTKWTSVIYLRRLE
ncbi:hypothetical protein [Herbaspirillum huttiense]|uniref:ASCH domain-containing protein n=1 Tax=Herbaspirillum huttiense subsp. lycopersici TaxID=3074428 RepID=A0ABU2EGY5_9BURK|nr:hypothetical protein [Herbaspirillum huttiense]MDR9847118.1 hypothetical protein [Herbaspirillum huttiense SE1]